MNSLRDSLSAQAGLVVELMTAAVEPELRAAGISLATFDLLSAVQAAGTATQADVARRLGLTPPTLSEAVKAAVQRGLLEQRPDPGDARLKRLRITDDGAQALARVLDGLDQAEESMLRGIDANEVAVTRQVLRRIVRNLAQTLQRR